MLRPKIINSLPPGKTLFPPLVDLFLSNNILKMKVCVDVEFLGREQDADISWVSLKHVHLGGLGARGVSGKRKFHLPVRCFYNSTQFPRDVVFSISRIVQCEQ